MPPSPSPLSPPTGTERLVIASGALTACLIATVCFASEWLGDARFINSDGTGEMAPLTALCLLLLGTALILRQWLGNKPAVRTLDITATVLIAAAPLLLTGSLTATGQAWEEALTSARALLRGMQPMHTRPYTLVLLMLSSLSLLLLQWAGRKAAARWAGIVLSSLVVVTCTTILINPLPMIFFGFEGPGHPTAFWSSVALTALNLSIIMALGLWRQTLLTMFGPESMSNGPKRHSQELVLFGLLPLLGILIVMAWINYVRHEMVQTRDKVDQSLTELAELKSHEIETWLHERMADGRTLMRAPWVAESAASLAAHPEDTALKTRLGDYFEQLEKNYGYIAIDLFNAELQPLLTSKPADVPTCPMTPDEMAQVRRAREASLVDLHRNENDAPEMHILVPLRANDGSTLIGALRLSIDPRQHLFPLVMQWPVSSESGEFILFRKEGESVLSLAPMQFFQDAALKKKSQITENPSMLAIQATHEPKTNLLVGVDYRGEPVVGVARHVAGTRWILIAKMDRAEAFADAKSEVLWITAGTALLLAIIGLGTALTWRQRQRALLLRQMHLEKEQAAMAHRLGVLMKNANDGILLFDENMRITEANDRAAALYGRMPEAMLGLTARDLRTDEANQNVHEDFSRASTTSGLIFETTHKRSDGTTFPVEVSSRPVEVDGSRQVLSIIRDITQRKRYEREIERLNRMYRVISHVNQTIIRTQSEAALFQDICRLLVDIGQFQIAWIGWLDPATQEVKPVAVAGDKYDYVGHIHISADPNVPEGRGPSGSAFRSGKTYVCNDFLADPVTVPWRERAARSGFQSSIALPLRLNGQVMGLLTVYAVEKGFFVPRKIAMLEEAAEDVSFRLGVFADDKRRREAEQALAAREEITSSILSQAPDAIVLIDATNGRFVEFNQSAHEHLGYTREEFAGMGIGDVDVGQTPGQILESLAHIHKSRGALFEVRHRRRNGDIIDVRVSSRPVVVRGREFITAIWTDITESKRLEGEMRKLSLVVDQGATSVVITDLAGSIEYVNPRFTELSGYTLEEVRGRNPRVLKSGLTDPSVYVDLWRTITAGNVWRGEIVNRKKNGELYTELVIITPVRDTGNQVTHYVALKEDITARKEAEESLRESDTRLAQIAAHSRTIIWETDAQGLYTFVSDVCATVIGYQPGELAGRKHFYDLHPAEGREAFKAAALEAFARKDSFIGLENMIQTKDGGFVWVSTNGMPILNPDGTLKGYRGSDADITTRKLAENTLRKFSRIIEQAPLSVAITDLTGALEYVNPRFCQVTGYAPEEVLGQNPRVLKSGHTPPEVYDDMWQTLTKGLIWRGELHNRKKNGNFYTESAVIAPVTDDSGRVTHYVALKEDITERKRTEAALQETRERYRLIAENTDDVIWLYDIAQDRFTYASPSMRKLSGFSPEEVIGLKMGDVLTPASQDYVARILPARLAAFAAGDQTARTAHDEVEQVRRDGGSVPIEVVSTLLANAEGKPVQILGTTRDITERRRADAALRESEQRFRELFDLESDAILVMDAETSQIVQANQAAAVIYGCTVDELLTLSGMDLTAQPELTREVFATAQRKPEELIHVAQRLHHKRDGKVFPVEFSMRPFRRGGRLMLVVAVRDITLEVAARETLQRFNAELEKQVAMRTDELAARNRDIEALLDAIPDTIMRLRADGTLLHGQPARSSPALAAITPETGGIPAAGPSAQLIAASLELGRRALAEADTVTGEAEITTPAGPLAVELRTAPTSGQEFVVFTRDITSRKRLERETAELLEKERQVSEMKTRFISMTSHEFRTPLAVTMGSVELLHNHLDRLAPAKREELFGRINTSIHRLTEMLDDILTLSRVDAGRVKLEPVSIDLREFLREAIEETRMGDRDRHRFEFKAQGDDSGFVSDPAVLHHIVSNLLGNATRYSPPGTVVTTHLHTDARRLIVSVEDQGIGIPPADLARILDPFERGSNVGTIKGTGLGLNIVKRLTEMLGGTVSIESVQDRGSRFTIEFARQPAPKP